MIFIILILNLIRQKNAKMSNSTRYFREKIALTFEIILKKMGFKYASELVNRQKSLQPYSNRMSAIYSQIKIRAQFTHENASTGKQSNFLPITSVSWVESIQKPLIRRLSCKENTQNLYMSNPTYKENSTFLYMSFFTFLYSLFIE